MRLQALFAYSVLEASLLCLSQAMEQIELYIALTEPQFEQLKSTGSCSPDPFSQRWGLRRDPNAAIERSYYFNNWKSATCWEAIFNKKSFLICKAKLSAVGLLRLTEAGRLLIKVPGEYQLHGPLSLEMEDGEFSIDPEVFQVV